MHLTGRSSRDALKGMPNRAVCLSEHAWGVPLQTAASPMVVPATLRGRPRSAGPRGPLLVLDAGCARRSVARGELTLFTLADHFALPVLDMRAICSLLMKPGGAFGWGDPMHIHGSIPLTGLFRFAPIETLDQLPPKRGETIPPSKSRP